MKRLSANYLVVVSFLLSGYVLIFTACSGNSGGTPVNTDLVAAKVAGFTAVDQYLHDHPDRVASTMEKVQKAEALLTAGNGSYDALQALLFAGIDDPRKQFYFGIVMDLVEPYIGTSAADHGAVIKPGSKADLVVRAALAGARQALAIPRT